MMVAIKAKPWHSGEVLVQFLVSKGLAERGSPVLLPVLMGFSKDIASPLHFCGRDALVVLIVKYWQGTWL